MVDLKKERENMIGQRDNALAVYNQAVGAIAMLDYLIAQEPQPTMTEEELTNALKKGGYNVEGASAPSDK